MTGRGRQQPGPDRKKDDMTAAVATERATPKTQSALLEAMQERRVSVDGVTHVLPQPFLLIATQNPIELAGTFPLPEAQLDRFLFKISLGYPSLAAEIEVMDANSSTQAV